MIESHSGFWIYLCIHINNFMHEPHTNEDLGLDAIDDKGLWRKVTKSPRASEGRGRRKTGFVTPKPLRRTVPRPHLDCLIPLAELFQAQKSCAAATGLRKYRDVNRRRASKTSENKHYRYSLNNEDTRWCSTHEYSGIYIKYMERMSLSIEDILV
jgi:hypothetical protein